jgi:hypothetical protein
MDICWLWANTGHIKDLGQSIAWLAAAAFFAWKVWTGYTHVNLSVDLTTSRFPSPEKGKDYLLLRLELIKGERAKLSLTQLVFQIKPTEGSQIQVALGPEELRAGPNNRPLKLTAGEETHFEKWVMISANEPYLVIAELQGRSVKRGYWRATSVTLPKHYVYTVPAQGRERRKET